MIRRCDGTDPNLLMYIDTITMQRLEEDKLRPLRSAVKNFRFVQHSAVPDIDEEQAKDLIARWRAAWPAKTYTRPKPTSVAVPCDCGLVFDDARRTVIYPHPSL